MPTSLAVPHSWACPPQLLWGHLGHSAAPAVRSEARVPEPGTEQLLAKRRLSRGPPLTPLCPAHRHALRGHGDACTDK